MKIRSILLLLFVLFISTTLLAQQKREFRGAWIQAVNGQFQGLGRDKMQQTLTYQLDELQKDGCNAIIFQVRPECDALYESKLEPWSRFLTGEQGRAPQPYWDPLQWMIDECHKRGMELHAWINPFRAKTKTTHSLSTQSWVAQHPELWFEYDGLYILNPALQENTDYTCRVVKDILERYDVDGLHIDDYFYPYPVSGVEIPDMQYYMADNRGFKNIEDWRRDNVNCFIQTLYNTIHTTKPWVKFGVSPFGIYRNKKSDPLNGSETNGLQNYDQLYADVLLWVNNGWVDYCVPQIYWEMGNKAADYTTLIKWWSKYCSNRPLFIGEDVERTVKHADPNNAQTHQMDAKYRMHRELPNIDGTVLWYAKAAVDNIGNYGTLLRNKYWKTPALQPLMPFIDNTQPKAVQKLKTEWTADGFMLKWSAPKSEDGWRDEAHKYVVYKFAKGEKLDTSDASKIVAITTECYYKLPYQKGKEKFTYVVTALNRLQNEGKATKKKIRL